MLGKRLLRTVYFSDRGQELATKLSNSDGGFIVDLYDRDISIDDWIRDSFDKRLPILFIGATGIAVRLIAPFIHSKLTDSPVIVCDELGEHVIPILSGHFGGANEIATEIADILNSTAVITTATDINGVFAIDTFARINGLKINNKSGIKHISSKLLAGEDITIRCDIPCNFIGNTPEHVTVIDSGAADVVISDHDSDGFTLIPKRLVIGMGCKKGKSFEDLHDFVCTKYEEDYLRDNLYGFATIDVKSEEKGLITLAHYFNARFMVYTAEELSSLPGEYTDSSFVRDTVGVSNVCERAAICGAALSSRQLVLPKEAMDGMTIAVASRQQIDLNW